MIAKRLKELAVIPVVTIRNDADAGLLGDALVQGGLPCAEITLRTDAALGAIRILARNKDILVGAGTVLSIEQAETAKEAGAEFLVTPGLNPKVVQWSLDHNIPIYPGISTASEIEMALDFGLTQVKFFPAEAFGGAKTIKALSKPYHMMEFIPTGGISLDNLGQYLAIPQVLACGGSWMVEPDWIQDHHYHRVIVETRKAVQAIMEIRGKTDHP
ncbi:bifunctional 4-hydroxy-2-oxoglutarate aldolase/2-dehydro-3-deoxy-phosphogluconate aldolase [bacterium]|nr:bifunctional 4-hydroxy-2-oxoglutarate aldolase/2-dehydro-3-deoxy-phosphogluconate aldolase [bacterium]